ESGTIRRKRFGFGCRWAAWTGGAHDSRGAFQEQTGQFTMLVPNKFSSRWISCLASDPRQLQRQRIAHRLVPARMRDDDRMVRAGAVQVRTRRVPSKFRFLVARTVDPLSRR